MPIDQSKINATPELQQTLQQSGEVKRDILENFAHADSDKDGAISYDQFKNVLQQSGYEFSDQQVIHDIFDIC